MMSTRRNAHRLPAAMAVGVVIFLAAAVLALRPIGDKRERRDLTGFGQGEVTQVVILDEIYTQLTVRWSDARGGRHQSQFDTDTGDWSVGEPLDVRYDPRRPSRAVPADEYLTDNAAQRTTARVEGAVTMLVGLGLLVGTWLRPRRAKVFGCDPALTWPAPGTPAASVTTAAAPHLRWPPTPQQNIVVAWNCYGQTARATLAGAFGAAALTALLFSWVLHSDAQLLQHGTPAKGTVAGGGYGFRFTQDNVRVRYVDSAGRAHDGTLHGPNPDHLARGSQVTVVYDLSSPERFRTRQYPNHGNVLNAALDVLPIAALGLALCGGVTYRRWHRGRELLTSGVVEEAAVCAVRRHPNRGSTLLAVVGEADTEPVVLRLTGGQGELQASAALTGTTTVSLHVCSSHPDVLVVAPHLDRPHFASLPRTTRQRERWRRRLQHRKAESPLPRA